MSSGPQREIKDWTLRKRPGTPMAEAAESAKARATSHTDGSQLENDPGSEAESE